MNESVGEVEWIIGCTVCGQGMSKAVEETNKRYTKKNILKACEEVAQIINQRVGVDGFATTESVRAKYRRFKGEKSDPPKKGNFGRSAQTKIGLANQSNKKAPQERKEKKARLIFTHKEPALMFDEITVKAASYPDLIRQAIHKMEVLEYILRVLGTKLPKELKKDDHGIEGKLICDFLKVSSKLAIRITESVDGDIYDATEEIVRQWRAKQKDRKKKNDTDIQTESNEPA